jgi:hypothetical protein
LKEKSLVSLAWNINKLKGLLKTALKTEIAKEYCLEDFEEAVNFYKKNMSAGKVLFRP